MSLNEDAAAALAKIARLQDLLGMDHFRAISNDRAARAVEGLSQDLSALAESRESLLAIDGIGPKIADKLIEFYRTGRMQELDDLQAQVPAGVLQMLDVPGLGPKTAAVLWKQGGIESIPQLKAAIDSGALLDLPRMGEKSIQKLKESIAIAEEGQKRLPLGVAMAVAEDFVESMRRVKGVVDATYAGSLRRGKETIGDIDVLVCVKKPDDAPHVAEHFRSLPRVNQVLTAGATKSSVRAAIRADNGRVGNGSTELRSKGGEIEEVSGPSVQVDLRVLPIEHWGAALMYFTGSKEHNIRLRERALKQGRTLNDYGLFPEDGEDTPPQTRGIKPIASRTEEEIYSAMGLPYIPPELREDRSELELTKTPRLIEIDDIKAELHAHTTASDGSMEIEELATEAKRRGFHTIAVTDHSKSSAIAGGLPVDRLLEHINAVRRVNDRIKGITVLAGSEVDILADGSLDYPDDVLAQLDVVVASPHTALSQEPSVATERLLRAIRHPHVHILGHPTGRLINRRAGLSPDMAKLIAAAVEHDVALEINAHWMRLDLRDVHVRAAVDAGCKLAIDCDVHAPGDFDNLRFGIMTARRGWLTPDLCINTWSATKLHDWLQSKRSGGTSNAPPSKKVPTKQPAKRSTTEAATKSRTKRS
ncbi:MAG: PHP domain-containing protein [Phycisphaeraceae bacterium]|nr:PHP domain-containing protein [Phycisphaeraceae bacterium]